VGLEFEVAESEVTHWKRTRLVFVMFGMYHVSLVVSLNSEMYSVTVLCRNVCIATINKYLLQIYIYFYIVI